MRTKLLSLVALILLPLSALAQAMLSESEPVLLIDFSASTPASVGSNPPSPYAGLGFEPNTTIAGRLNSNAWSVSGLSFGALNFGDVQTVDSFGRASTISGVLSNGLYAFIEQPGSVENPSFLMQPGTDDLMPGSVTLRIQNTGTVAMTTLTINYDVLVRNDGENSAHLDFAYSANNTTYTNVPAMRYTSPTGVDNFGYQASNNTPTHSYTITGLSIAPGAYYYIRWAISDADGEGEYDELGLDNIKLTGTFGTAQPKIEISTATNLIMENGDTTPSTAEGTLFSTAASPISTVNSSVLVAFTIKNKGTSNLNISSVTFAGANPEDFSTYISPGAITGNLTPIGTAGSQKTFYIRFTPSEPGYRSARILINSNDITNSPFWFDLGGYGRIPHPDISVKPSVGNVVIPPGSTNPTNFNGCLFPETTTGSFTDKGFRIANDGNIGVQLLLTGDPKIVVEGANPEDFIVLVQPVANALHAGQTAQFTIRFSPTAFGVRTAIISIANNDVVPDPSTGNNENPYTFMVKGVGRGPEMDVLGNEIIIPDENTLYAIVDNTDFEDVGIGGSKELQYTITNTGNQPLNISGVSFSGDAAGDYSLVTNPEAVVAANVGTTTFTVRFTPSQIGERLATIAIASNDLDETPYNFNLKGNGTNYVPCETSSLKLIGQQQFNTSAAVPNWIASGHMAGAFVGYGAEGDGGESPRYLGNRSAQVFGFNDEISFNPQNTTTYNEHLELTFRLAAFGGTATEGVGNEDEVRVYVSKSDGTFSHEMTIRGGGASKWSFQSGKGLISQDFDGDNSATEYVAGPNYATQTGYSFIRIKNLPNISNLRIRFEIVSISIQRIWALDDVRLFGRSVTSTTWNGSAWSNGVPTDGVKAIINGNYSTTAAGLEACECQINSGRTLTVNPGHTLSVQSDLKISGNLVLENSGSLVQRDNFAENSGNITYKRSTTPVRKFDFTYWSSPVQNLALNTLSPLTLFDKYFSYDSSVNNWKIESPTNQMTPGRGYIIRSPNNFSTTVPAVFNAQFAGVPNNGIVEFPVEGAAGNFQLIGNPYPSAVSAAQFISDPTNSSLLNGTLYFWTHNTPITNYSYTVSDYATYNLLGSTGTTSPEAGANNDAPLGYIASGQSFMSISRGNGNVRFDNSMRVKNNNTQFYRLGLATESSATTPSRYWLAMTDVLGNYKEALVGYTSLATTGLDYGYDGESLATGDFSLATLVDQTRLTIQARPAFEVNDRVVLGVSGMMGQLYEIALARTDGLFDQQAIFIEDAALGVIHDLRLAPYQFRILGNEENRFHVRYTEATLGNSDWTLQEGVAVIKTADGLSFRSYEDVHAVKVYNLQGQLLGQYKVDATEASISLMHLGNQIVLIEFELQDQTLLYKKFNW